MLETKERPRRAPREATREVTRAETQTNNESLRLKLRTALEKLRVLPVGAQQEAIRAKLKDPKVVELLADCEPASGKTFVMPMILLDVLMDTDPNAKIAVVESRRSIAIQLGSNGERIAGRELEEKDMKLRDRLGDENVGYTIKGHHAADTVRINFPVVDSLINMFIEDPTLSRYAGVMVDEAHLYTGLLKPLLRDANALRARQGMPPLKIIFATGTADEVRGTLYEMFPNMAEIKVEGRKHEVPFTWSDRSYSNSEAAGEAAKLAEKIIRDKQGNILIFGSGGQELDDTITALLSKSAISSLVDRQELEIIRVMGKDKDLQKKLETSTKRKIIVSTDALAEGVDPDCDFTIVPCWRKVKEVDPITCIEELKVVPASKNTVVQEAKRAGRKRPGEAYFLISKADFDRLPGKESQVHDITQDILRLLVRGYKNVRNFKFEGDKDPAHINAAIIRLQKWGALDKNEKKTDIGDYMAECNVEPRYARMLYEAEKRGCADAVAILIGIITSDQSIFRRGWLKEDFMDRDSDFIALLKVWNAYANIMKNDRLSRQQRDAALKSLESAGINVSVLAAAAFTRKELVSNQGNLYQEVMLEGEGDQTDEIKKSVLPAFADMRSKRERKNQYYRLQGTNQFAIQIGRNSVLADKLPTEIVSATIRRDGDRKETGYSQVYDEKTLYEVAPYLRAIETDEEAEAVIAEQEANAQTAGDTRADDLPVLLKASTGSASPSATPPKEQSVVEEQEKPKFLTRVRKRISDFFVVVREWWNNLRRRNRRTMP